MQGQLSAEADAHARNVAERDRFIKTVAAQTGLMQLEGVHMYWHVSQPSAMATIPIIMPFPGLAVLGSEGAQYDGSTDKGFCVLQRQVHCLLRL